MFTVICNTNNFSYAIKKATKSKKIAIIHYRVGKTDGVSLEIEKRQKTLEAMGHQVRLISGPIQNGSDFIINELEFENQDILQIKENSFKYFQRKDLTPKQLLQKIFNVAEKIKKSSI